MFKVPLKKTYQIVLKRLEDLKASGKPAYVTLHDAHCPIEYIEEALAACDSSLKASVPDPRFPGTRDDAGFLQTSGPQGAEVVRGKAEATSSSKTHFFSRTTT